MINRTFARGAFVLACLLPGIALGSEPVKASRLADRSREQPKLFTELEADGVGVGSFVNNYSSPDVWGAKWQQYLLGAVGTGVAIGDVDEDGWPDIFVVSKNEDHKLYRNLGGMRFADETRESGIRRGAAPASGCAFVDVDNDGDLDLYVCSIGGPNELWLNDGKGRFTECAGQWGVAVNSGSNMAAFADFNRDGLLDLYVGMNSIVKDGTLQPLADRLFRNQGNTFVEVTEAAGISGIGQGHSATWWDFDEDGWPDLYVTRDFEPLDKLYRNNGDGTFTDVLSTVMPVAPYYSMGADFGDINNDGHFDFWVADMSAVSRYKRMRTVGNHDQVYKVNERHAANQYLKNVLALRLSSTQFADIAFLAGLDKTDWTWAPRLVDLDNDGWLDAFASNGILRAFADSDLGGKIQSSANYTSVFRATPVQNEANLAFRNRHDLTFESVGSEWGLGKVGVSFGVACGDLDRNGTMDIVVNNYGQKLSIFRNNEAANQAVTLRLHGTKSNRYGIGAKVTAVAGNLRQVKALSLTRGYMSTDEQILHFGLGENAKLEVLEIDWPSGIHQRIRDLTAGYHYDIEEKDDGHSEKSVKTPDVLFTPWAVDFPATALRNEADFEESSRQQLVPFPQSRLGGSVAIGDLNGDGLNDLVFSGATGQGTAVLVNRGGSRFGDRASLDIEEDFVAEDRSLALADLHHDGRLDLLVTSGGIELGRGDPFYANRIYRNDGKGEFLREPRSAFSETTEPSGVMALGDFDQDGEVDLFVAGGTIPGRYPYVSAAGLYRTSGDKLIRVDGSVAPGLAEVGRVSGAVFADIDGDGDLDLVLVREWATPMVWKNTHGTFVVQADAFDPHACAGLWSSLAVTDLDGNGHADIVVGNLGLNSKYRAAPDAPMRLWFSSSSSDRIRLIHTTTEDGEEWPVEPKKQLQAEFPETALRKMSFETYARSNLDQLFPHRQQDGYRSMEITEVRSGVFWQDAKGRFTFEPLPMFAQSGRVVGLMVQDLNGDGTPDIVASLDYPRVETRAERFEKGHVGVFLNRGGRTFEALLPGASGLSINGAPRELGWGDLDGDQVPELIVVLNEGVPQVFKWQSR